MVEKKLETMLENTVMTLVIAGNIYIGGLMIFGTDKQQKEIGSMINMYQGIPQELIKNSDSTKTDMFEDLLKLYTTLKGYVDGD